MEPYDLGGPGDLGALNNRQQAETNRLKTETRLNNEKYMRRHPEIRYIISAFLRDLLLTKPEDPRKHFTDFFSRPDLSDCIEKAREVDQQRQQDDKMARDLACEESEDEED
ncbi:unnamed protein product [Dicrocoelium dendriticum]|nr:unnamed protein product [Dicrocoelium dendriticum]